LSVLLSCNFSCTVLGSFTSRVFRFCCISHYRCDSLIIAFRFWGSFSSAVNVLSDGVFVWCPSFWAEDLGFLCQSSVPWIVENFFREFSKEKILYWFLFFCRFVAFLSTVSRYIFLAIRYTLVIYFLSLFHYLIFLLDFFMCRTGKWLGNFGPETPGPGECLLCGLVCCSTHVFCFLIEMFMSFCQWFSGVFLQKTIEISKNCS
jgi:hypothetical protein